MENYKAEEVTAASLPFDILTNIFHFLNTKNKGNAAQVCSSWKNAANCKSLWKFAQVTLRSGNLNIQTGHNIIKRDIKRFRVCVFEPKVNEFLRQVPNLEHLRFIGCCMKQNLQEILDTFPEGAEFLRLAAQDYRPHVSTDILIPTTEALLNHHKINESNCMPVNDHVLKTIVMGMKHLKVLHLDGCKWADRKSIGSNINTDLFIGKSTANEDRLPSLEKLCLRNFHPVNQETMGYITQTFVNLISLNFEFCDLSSDEGYALLPKLKKLEFLSFLQSSGVTDSWLNSIGHLSNLKFLDLSNCHQITKSGFKPISRLKNLTHLKLYNLRVTDAAYRYLNETPRLQELVLNSCDISDMGISYLAEGNLKLTRLSLSFCARVTNRGLLNICRSTLALQRVKLVSFNFTDYGVRCIMKRFPDLQVLDLTRCMFIHPSRVIFGNRYRNKNVGLGYIANDSDPMALSTNSRLDSFLNKCFWM